jgi:hypothetical protein
MTRNEVPAWEAPPSPRPRSSSSEPPHQAPGMSEGQEAPGMWKHLSIECELLI